MSNWVKLAAQTAQNSKDPKRKVGAVLITARNELAATGFNHFPPGTPEEFWEASALRLMHVVHAEVAALMSSTYDQRKESTLYVTKHPCLHCAVLIAEAGVNRVVCPRDENEANAFHVMDRANIVVEYYE